MAVPLALKVLLLVAVVGGLLWGVLEILSATSSTTTTTVETVPGGDPSDPPPTSSTPGETWFGWQDEPNSPCYFDPDPAAAFDRARLVPLNCHPNLTVGLPGKTCTLQVNNSSTGREWWTRRFGWCDASLPQCCVANPGGMTATEPVATAMGATQNEAFGKICKARYDCEHDPVYTSGAAPWMPTAPLDCFSEANVNTCVHMMMERRDPGTWRPGPGLQTEENADTLTYICNNDRRKHEPVVVPGTRIPTMSAAELATACSVAGFDRTTVDTSADCPTVAAGARRQSRESADARRQSRDAGRQSRDPETTRAASSATKKCAGCSRGGLKAALETGNPRIGNEQILGAMALSSLSGFYGI